MRQLECVYAWNPGTDYIQVGSWPDQTGWSDPYVLKAGACRDSCHKMNVDELAAQLFIDFHTIVVRDRIPVAVAHAVFLAIDEYREQISHDIPGAEA